jgi:O-antigen/teichoic acid export membrane protein
MGIVSKAVSNTFYIGLDWLSVTVVGYIFWVSMGKLLTPADYGVIATLLALYNLSVYLVTLNGQDVLVKFIPQFMTEGKKETAFSIVTYIFIVSLALTILFSFLTYMFSNDIAVILYHSTSGMAEGIRLLALMVFSGCFFLNLKAVLYSTQNFKAMFVSDLVGGAVRIGVAVGLALGGYALGGIWGWLAGFICAAVLELFFAFNSGFRFSTAGGFCKKDLIRYSSASVIYLLGNNIMFQVGMLALGIISTMHSAGLYAIGMLFGHGVVIPIVIFQGAFFPLVSELLSKKSADKASELINRSLKYIFALSIPMLVIVWLFSSNMIEIIYTADYIEAAGAVSIYATALFISCMSSIPFSMLFITGQPFKRVKIIAVGLVTNVTFTLLLIRSMDIVGVALAFLISSSFVAMLAYRSVKKSTELRLSVNLKKMALPLLIFAIPYAVLNTMDVSPVPTLAILLGFYLLYLYLLLKRGLFDKKDGELLDYVPMPRSTNFIIVWIKAIIKKSNNNSPVCVKTD